MPEDVQAARRAYRRRLHEQINERIPVVTDYLPAPAPAPPELASAPPPRPRLRAYTPTEGPVATARKWQLASAFAMCAVERMVHG